MKFLFILAALGCDGASNDTGRSFPLQLREGGQFRPGAFPDDAGGPMAVQVLTDHAQVAVGQLTERMFGLLGPTARSAIIGLGVDPDGCSATSSALDGAWIIPAGPPDTTQNAMEPTANLRYGLQPDAPLGPMQLLLAAGDETGAVGARACADFTAVPAAQYADAGVPNELVITLTWQGAADLDLHVVDGEGHEAWSEVPNTYQPTPGQVDPPGTYLKGGILDRDANARCERDARPQEDIIWSAGHAPPSGPYTVRVEAVSLCGDPSEAWDVVAYRQTMPLGHAQGVSTIDDVQGPHGRGAGTTALTFTIP